MGQKGYDNDFPRDNEAILKYYQKYTIKYHSRFNIKGKPDIEVEKPLS